MEQLLASCKTGVSQQIRLCLQALLLADIK
jgi:hypothetical protein